MSISMVLVYFWDDTTCYWFSVFFQKSLWTRGRVLGGTSSLNYMAYVRGSRHDFDHWAAEGCTGWSYKDVLPYFLKMEDSQIPSQHDSRMYNISVLCYLKQRIL